MNENEILAELNPEQREVVLHDKGPLLAVAVAGAGKTKTVVHRIAYLVNVRGVDPGRVLAVTFSKKGADEMNERLVKLIGKSDARVGTFHSLALEILRAETLGTTGDGGWVIDDRNRYAICLKDAVGYKELNIAKEVDITELQMFIGRCKAAIARPGSDGAFAIAARIFDGTRGVRLAMESYERAEELRKDRKLLGFDDMLIDCAELLRDNAEVCASWAKNWDYVIQDEAQDQNLCQLVIGEQLARSHQNYMLVGDPAQTIFSFRGAMPEKLLGFEKTWGARVIKMSKNYRCGDEIIDVSNRALSMMDSSQRLDVTMEACRGVPGTITAVEHPTPAHEALVIAEMARQHHEDGKAWADMVVLYRTHACSRAIEEAMLQARIPYVVLGGANFYERREVRSLLAYLRLAAGRGDGDDVERCINAPFRFLGRAFVERVVGRAQEAHRGGEKLDWLEIVRKVAKEAGIQTRQKRSAEEWANLVHGAADQVAGKPCACTSGVSAPGFRRHPSRPPVDFDECVVCGGTGVETVSPATILRQITRMTGYIQWLKDDEGDESVENDRASNVAALTEVVAPRFQTTAELLDYIEQTQQKVAAERKNAGKDDKVILTSCHRAKGLEWPVVFLAGVSAGQFPHAMAEDVEEEKRLFYVGLTRARDYLHVSATSIGVSGREAGASLFLDAVGLV